MISQNGQMHFKNRDFFLQKKDFAKNSSIAGYT